MRMILRDAAIVIASALLFPTATHALPAKPAISADGERLLHLVQGRYGQLATLDADVTERIYARATKKRSLAQGHAHFGGGAPTVWTMRSPAQAPRARWDFVFIFLRNQSAGVNVEARVDVWTRDPAEGWIVFTPNTVTPSSTRISLLIDPETGRLATATIDEANGDRDAIDFQNEKLTY